MVVLTIKRFLFPEDCITATPSADRQVLKPHSQKHIVVYSGCQIQSPPLSRTFGQ